MKILDSILGFAPKKQSQDQQRTILGIAILSKFRISNSNALLQEIVDEQCLHGNNIDEHVATHVIPVGASVNDGQYALTKIARLFPDVNIDEILSRSETRSFQSPDGNFGQYYLIFKNSAR